MTRASLRSQPLDGGGDSPAAHGPDRHRRRALSLATLCLLGLATVGAATTSASGGASDSTDAPESGSSTRATIPDLEGDLGQNEAEPTAAVDSGRADGGCTIGALSLHLGANGDGVRCLQQVLLDRGYYDGVTDGQYDDATLAGVMAYQADAGLFVDGVVGRESASELGIWPDEASLVVHTPPPPPNTPDSTGYYLSPVASMGTDAPPLPPNSGSGRRVVYDRAGQRVWAVDADERIVRSWLVSGSRFSNEQPGTHTVYSRSETSTAWNGQAILPKMIRYQRTEIGHIGFHGIPHHISDNSPYQTTEELGTRLSGGCQRQHDLDAAFLWAWADIGTKVVVT